MGTASQLDDATVESLRERLHGAVLQPDDDGYDEARSVWNAMIDTKPAVVARCTGAADVMTAVDVAREHGVPLAVKGGGHNVAGTALCEGLVIDLAPMDWIRVDPAARTARVGAGATWGDVDHETQAFGLATTGGIVTSTGVAGLTLGGGLGYLARKFGLAHDNLRSVDVVTAAGELVHASADERSDLFWAMRGGGGNFGVATAFEFDLHELGPEILSVRLLYPYEAVPETLQFYEEFMSDAPNEVGCYAAILRGSPEYGLPEPLHGETLLAFRGLYAGDVAEARAAFQPLRDFGDPIADLTETMPYTVYQAQADELYCEGHRNYWKSNFYDEISEGFVETLMNHVESIPSPYSSMFFEWMEGAIAEADATAFPHRDRTFSFTVAPKWTDSERDEEHLTWAREFHEALKPYAADGVYVNYMDDDEDDRVRAAYGDTYDRLVELKDEWDPDNLFSTNQNVEPTV
ncbi:FAD-binding oxidoreductase [Haloplanus rubicundus]|uniref:FAD-binding oxidoreductase n=1 Tax=Haloplanus rubicundus TaxID=1547898 RepID=A0A345E3F9_9EURY|nr:FAD-binding oxidoreductase [Haloplanus rubicundus]AXG06731.1 FAD-binding oxidoreductase [Haloplanus rubicundus]